MKFGLVLCVAAASAALGAVAAWPQDAKAKDGHSAPGAMSAEDMAKMMALGSPGPQHKALAEMVGKWKSELSYTMTPGAPAEKNVGTDEFTMSMDGRYLIDNHSSSSSMGPMKGMGITAYNNATGMYENVWLSSMGTGIFFSQGTADPESDAVNYKCEAKDCMTGRMTKYRMIMHKVNADEYSFQMFTAPESDPEFLAMSIRYTRQR